MDQSEAHLSGGSNQAPVVDYEDIRPGNGSHSRARSSQLSSSSDEGGNSQSRRSSLSLTPLPDEG